MIELLLLSLVCYRITSIVHHERIAEPLRRLIGYDGLSYPDNFLGSLFSCFWCLSVWCAGLAIILYVYFPILVWVFAVSAGAILIREIEEKG